MWGTTHHVTPTVQQPALLVNTGRLYHQSLTALSLYKRTIFFNNYWVDVSKRNMNEHTHLYQFIDYKRVRSLKQFILLAIYMMSLRREVCQISARYVECKDRRKLFYTLVRQTFDLYGESHLATTWPTREGAGDQNIGQVFPPPPPWSRSVRCGGVCSAPARPLSNACK